MSSSVAPRRLPLLALLTALAVLGTLAPAAAAAKPSITRVSQSGGYVAGTNVITITGTNFGGLRAVTVGGVAGHVTRATARRIVLVAPPQPAPGTVPVQVRTRRGASKVGSRTVYSTYAVPPRIDGISVSAGPLAGGTSLEIRGSSLTGAVVTFGGAPGATVSNDDRRLLVRTPAHGAGTVEVRATTPGAGGGTTTSPTAYTFVAPPVVATAAPAAGPVSGGQTVTIRGTALALTSFVSFGNHAAASFQVVSDTEVLAVTATATSPNDYGLTLVTPGGGTGLDAYRFVGRPRIEHVSSSAGPTGGGSQVTVTGQNLADVTSVAFGTTQATFVRNTDTELTVTVPAHTAGAVDVVATSVGGASAAETWSRYTYAEAPS